MLKIMPIGQGSKRYGHGFLLVCILVFGIMLPREGRCQILIPPGAFGTDVDATVESPSLVPLDGELAPDTAESAEQLEGLPVRKISFEGVDPARLAPLAGNLPQAVGTPLSLEKLKSSLRKLFATGLY